MTRDQLIETQDVLSEHYDSTVRWQLSASARYRLTTPLWRRSLDFILSNTLGRLGFWLLRLLHHRRPVFFGDYVVTGDPRRDREIAIERGLYPEPRIRKWLRRLGAAS